MIKRIIFDVDNTLMDFPKNYEYGYSSVLKKHNIQLPASDLYTTIGKYEKSGKYKYFSKEELLKLINKELNLNLDNTFINDYFDMYNNLIPYIPNNTIDTLEYLSTKYELVILSNWFTDSQKNRLKKAGILKYFKEVYGGDIVPMKPSKEAFILASGGFKPEECVIIGDNLEIDIKVPYNLGFNVYHLNKYGKTEYPTIKSIEELKEML